MLLCLHALTISGTFYLNLFPPSPQIANPKPNPNPNPNPRIGTAREVLCDDINGKAKIEQVQQGGKVMKVHVRRVWVVLCVEVAMCDHDGRAGIQRTTVQHVVILPMTRSGFGTT